MNKQHIEIAVKAIKFLAENPDMLGKLLTQIDSSMPNIQTKTLGGKVFWKNIAEFEGWKIQKNSILGNCRILNPENERVAWGGEDAMIRAFNKLFADFT